MTEHHMRSPSRWWLYCCLFLSGGVWGLTPVLARIATGGGADPLGLTLWQSIIGGGAVADDRYPPRPAVAAFPGLPRFLSIVRTDRHCGADLHTLYRVGQSIDWHRVYDYSDRAAGHLRAIAGGAS